MPGSTDVAGTIALFAGGTRIEIKNWAPCQGQLLRVEEYKELLDIIGSTYGGDGRTCFLLPDLRGKVPLCMSNQHPLGDVGGEAATIVRQENTPSHFHLIKCSTEKGDQTSLKDHYFAKSSVDSRKCFSEKKGEKHMKEDMLNSPNYSDPHNNMQPYLVVRYMICLHSQGSQEQDNN